MLTGPEALQNTVSWGVQRGLFAYALGDGTTFDTIRFRESLPAGVFEVIEGAWLLRPALAERLHQHTELEARPAPTTLPEQTPEPHSRPQPGLDPQPRQQAPPSPTTYHRVTIETPVDWRQWYDFYQSVVRPLVESGAEVKIQLRLEATGDVDVNLVDLSVRESVVQLNPRGKLVAE
jgi:hypothetical protein